jgi:hypothetical protein
MKILLIGEEDRIGILQAKFLGIEGVEVEISDGDCDEDFDEYDVIFDLTYDDDDENIEQYAMMRDKIVVLSAVKQTLAEASYKCNNKVKAKLFGINAIANYLDKEVWEVSAYRFSDFETFDKLATKLGIKYHKTADKVGMMMPRVDFVRINEISYCLEEGVMTEADMMKTIDAELATTIANTSITDIFETLISLYEETKSMRYHPSNFIKNKYLKNQSFFKK